MPCENMSSTGRRQGRSRSDCAFAQSDQGLHCPLTDSLATTKCMNVELRSRWYFAHVQDDLNFHILYIFEGIFSLGAGHICLKLGAGQFTTWWWINWAATVQILIKLAIYIGAIWLSCLTHFRLNKFYYTIYWKSPISVLGMSGYVI